jgi:drug/metabolite transporter (DMT)-like permease
VSQAFGALFLFGLVAAFGGTGPAAPDMLWGAAGGAAGAIGIVALYAALATGPMTLVAPVTASLAAALPAIWDVATNGLPGPLTIVGLALAFLAILTISAPDPHAAAEDRVTSRVLALAVTAGLMFAAFFVLLSNTGPDAGMWPLVGSRIVSLPLLFAIAIARHADLRISAGARVPTLSAGALDMAANAFVLAALQIGPLAVASVLSSLYPAATALLAWSVLKERPDTRHKVGIVLALVAVALTAAP